MLKCNLQLKEWQVHKGKESSAIQDRRFMRSREGEKTWKTNVTEYN